MAESSYDPILKSGEYCNPAWKYYGRDTAVFCAKCKKQCMPDCIGLKDQHLCIGCAHELSPSSLQSTPHDSQYLEVVQYGKIYTPAWTHYGYKAYVGCDRCKNAYLDTCMGYETSDLCMNCVVQLKKNQMSNA